MGPREKEIDVKPREIKGLLLCILSRGQIVVLLCLIAWLGHYYLSHCAHSFGAICSCIYVIFMLHFVILAYGFNKCVCVLFDAANWRQQIYMFEVCREEV